MLIGLAGAAGAGKGSVANVLVREHGFSEIAFADPLYEAVSAILQVPVGHLKDRSVKEEAVDWVGKSPRELLQLLGTEFGRKMISESIWVDAGMRRAASLRRYGEDVVITDVRFDNEAEAILEAGGVVWEVTRRTPSCLRGTAAKHESEAGISSRLITLSLANDGSLGDLSRAVDHALLDATRAYNAGSVTDAACTDCAHDRRNKTVNS